ncbi:MAG: DoxX family protein [Polaromonas sp.]|uniref:DoxX family protein n=1 Tax=Polaromonas sp. TaxID=1869339 RepID=UPI0025D8BE99|nr:DoxX family protein [Polaromonas sp.]MBI2725640.1 DoxX family protein [Polaromonas sp.]
MLTSISKPIESLLHTRWLYYVGAVLLTFIFWGSGIAKLTDFANAQKEMAMFGLNPPALYAIATIIVQLGGSALIISGSRLAWLGAGALAVFTILTIFIAHRFWEMTGEQAFHEKMFAFEHITVIGGLIVISILAELRRKTA